MEFGRRGYQVLFLDRERGRERREEPRGRVLETVGDVDGERGFEGERGLLVGEGDGGGVGGGRGNRGGHRVGGWVHVGRLHQLAGFGICIKGGVLGGSCWRRGLLAAMLDLFGR